MNFKAQRHLKSPLVCTKRNASQSRRRFLMTCCTPPEVPVADISSEQNTYLLKNNKEFSTHSFNRLYLSMNTNIIYYIEPRIITALQSSSTIID